MKKILVFASIFCIVASSSLYAKVIGDFNADGQVNLSDAIALIIHLNGGKQIAEVGDELGAAEPDLVRPPRNDEYAYARVDTNFFREAVLIVDELKEKSWDALLNSADHERVSFSGEVSGSAVASMRMPAQYWEEGREVPEWSVYRVTLDNYSSDGKYYISGELNYYSRYHLDYEVDIPTIFYNFSGTMFIIGDINADLIISGDYILGAALEEGGFNESLFKNFNTRGFIKSCVPGVLQGQDGWCRGFGFSDTLLFPLDE